MRAQPSLTYTAACPRCGHDCTWTAETYYDDITTLNHPVSDTDGGNCGCAPAPAAAGREVAA